MAKLLKGADAAKKLTEELKLRADKLKERGIQPCLAVVRVGEREDDIAYERGAMKRCEKIGIEVKNIRLPQNVEQDILIYEIEKLNDDEAVHGVLILRPLPKHIDDNAVCAALDPAKDADGITAGSLAGIYAFRDTGYAPCTAQACIELLKFYDIPLAGRNAVVIGRSLVIGRPVSMLLLKENATVTVCHSKTKGLADICRNADIIIAAAGKAGMLRADHVSAGQTVIDVGIHEKADGSLCGDAAFEEIEGIVEAITPVPGGVGAVTTAILASHVIDAAERIGKTL